MNIKGILAVFMAGAIYTLGSVVTAEAIRYVSDERNREVLKQKINRLKVKIFKRRESV